MNYYCTIFLWVFKIYRRIIIFLDLKVFLKAFLKFLVNLIFLKIILENWIGGGLNFLDYISNKLWISIIEILFLRLRVNSI